jgi:PAS domain S-box-containing protein
MPADYFRAIIDSIGDPVIVKDRNHRFVFANDAACRIFGTSLDQLLGKSDYDLFPKEQADVFIAHDLRVFETGERDANEEQITDARGGIRTILTIKTLYCDEKGERYVVGVGQDISDRKAAEEATLRLNRELRAVSDCNQVLLRATEEKKLLEDVCRVICEEAGYRMAWVGYAEDDEERTVRPMAWAGVEEGYLAAIRMTWADTERGQNATGRAIREGKSFCIQDVMSERPARYREKGLERGYRSNSAFPLKDEEGRAFGALTIYSGEAGSFDQAEMRLLEELAGDLAFGILVLRARAERAKAEEALRASESRLSQAMDIAKIVYWEIDWKSQILTANDAFYTFHATTAAREGGYRMATREYGNRFVHPGDVPIVARIVPELEAGTDPEFVVDYEHRIIRRDGEIRHIITRMRGFRDEAGRIVRCFGAYQDITERKKLEVAVAQAEAKYRSIFENAVVGIFQTTIEGRILSANPAFARLLGYGSPEELTTSLTDIERDLYFNREDRVRLQDLCQAYGAVEGFEIQFYRKDRSTSWGSLNVSATRDAEGRITGFEGTVEDITERKRSQDELLQSRQQLMNIIDFLPDATFVIDKEKRVIAWNRACEQMTGVKKVQILGKGDFAYAVPFYGEARPILIDYVASNSDALTNYSDVRRVGNRLYAQAFVPGLYGGKGGTVAGHASPLFDTNGNVVGAIESVRDVTEFRRLEDELRQSQKMESVGRLAGGVAHDFNNMLTVVLGYAELAMNRYSPSEQIYGDLKTIRQAALQSSGLVRQLLAFARKQTVAPQVLDLNDTVAGMLKMLRRLIGEDIDFAWMPGAGVWPVKIDPSQIDQLLANLCVNARDAINGVGRVVIETENAVFDGAYCDVHTGFAPGEYVVLAVSDSGCGMDKETAAQIFEPFFTTKEKGRGTGLGLATVYGIVKQNRGFVNVYSEPGRGSTFRIYLPRSPMETVESIVAAPEEIPGARGERVLLVEDDPAILALGRLALEQLGYSVVSAGTPAEALQLAKNGDTKIDLLITDVVMPGMNGRDLATHLFGMIPGLRCLFISGYTANVIAHHSVLDEGVHFLEKPFSVRSLAVRVREVLEKA